MNFEYKNIIATAEKGKEVLDDKWYDRFREVAPIKMIKLLSVDNSYSEDQRGKFIKNEIENPTMVYSELENFDFKEKERILLELKKDILSEESEAIIKQIYRWRINEEIATLRMLRSTKEGNDRKFNKYSKFIFGKPDKEIYAYTLNQVGRVVEEKSSSNDPDIKATANRLKKELLGSKKEAQNTEYISGEYIFPTLKSTENENECSSEEIKQAFESALDDYKIEGWKIIEDEEGIYKAISVNQVDKEINIPRGRKLKQTELTAVIAHEIGIHVLRRESGERTRLKLLGLGLDRYLKGEEGIATYEEQKIEGTNDFSGFDGHLAISLAAGMDGRKRTFREVFEILKDFYFIRSKKEKNEALKSAEISAWNRCVRTFRGTTCKTPGACLTRDIVYREGNIGIWNVIKNNPEEERRFSIGKYDPSNPRHIWSLEQLGITESDLKKLEE